MEHYFQQLMRQIDHMNTQEWLVFAIVAIAVGVACMRGRPWSL